MATVTMRFRGICCFIDPKNGQGKIFKKRVVLPNGGQHEHMGIEKHLPVIEFFAEDLESCPPDMEPVNFTRPGDDGVYQYIELKEAVSITLKGASKGKVRPSLSLDSSVIHLDELVQKPAVLKTSLLGEAVDADANLVKAVMDLPAGELASGPPEASVTEFLMSPKFTRRRVGRWLEHTVALSGKSICLELTPLGKPNAPPKQICFRDTTSLITIANEPLRLIVGKFVRKVNGEIEGLTPAVGMNIAPKAREAEKPENGKDRDEHTEQPGNGGQAQGTAHFNLYWELMQEPPKDRPRPASSQGSGPSCSPAIKP